MGLLKKKKEPANKQHHGYGGDKEANQMGVHRTGLNKGESDAGMIARKASDLSLGSGREHAMKMEDAKDMHREVLGELKAMKKPNLMAKGGMACHEGCAPHCAEHMVGNIMAKRMSMGGKVANSDEPIADFMPNEFDYLHLNDGLEEHYTGANSGDEHGDTDEDKAHNDMVAKVMMRRRKQHNPRPA